RAGVLHKHAAAEAKQRVVARPLADSAAVAIAHREPFQREAGGGRLVVAQNKDAAVLALSVDNGQVTGRVRGSPTARLIASADRKLLLEHTDHCRCAGL